MFIRQKKKYNTIKEGLPLKRKIEIQRKTR